MKNKGRKHKASDGNQKGCLCFITRDIRSMATPEDNSSKFSSKWMKKKWSKRVRGYFKSQTKDLLNQNEI